MKKSWVLIAAFIAVVVMGLVIALQTGEKSLAFARGTVMLSDDLNSEAGNAQTLFLILRDPDSQIPMPYGAAKFRVNPGQGGKLLDFVLTKEVVQVMSPNLPVPQRLNIKARLDQDGAGGMDQSGDLVGETVNIPLGSGNVEIVINKKIM